MLPNNYVDRFILLHHIIRDNIVFNNLVDWSSLLKLDLLLLHLLELIIALTLA